MEGLDSFHAHLKNLSHQAGILVEAAVSLSNSCKTEAERLTREDGAQRLKAIYAAVVEELERLMKLENAASYGYTKASMALSLAGFAAKLITAAATDNQRARNFVNHVFDTSERNKRPYGTVMIRVGPNGMPDDVRAISISELARESNRPEFEIIQELQEGGCLLFSQEMLSHLIDKLVIDVRGGRSYLPIPSEKLSEMVASDCLRLETKQSKWVLHSPPQ